MPAVRVLQVGDGQSGTLAAVKTIPARHVAMTGNRPAVVAIEIRAVSPGKGGL